MNAGQSMQHLERGALLLERVAQLGRHHRRVGVLCAHRLHLRRDLRARAQPPRDAVVTGLRSDALHEEGEGNGIESKCTKYAE